MKHLSVKSHGSRQHRRKKGRQTALRDQGKEGAQTDDVAGQRLLMTLCNRAVAATALEAPPSQNCNLVHFKRSNLAGMSRALALQLDS